MDLERGMIDKKNDMECSMGVIVYMFFENGNGCVGDKKMSFIIGRHGCIHQESPDRSECCEQRETRKGWRNALAIVDHYGTIFQSGSSELGRGGGLWLSTYLVIFAVKGSGPQMQTNALFRWPCLTTGRLVLMRVSLTRPLRPPQDLSALERMWVAVNLQGMERIQWAMCQHR